MKKLLLLVGLVVFLTPMVVSAEAKEELPGYIIKSDIACYTKPKKSRKCYLDTFEPYNMGGVFSYAIDSKNYTAYKIIESTNKNDVEWIKVCPYDSDGTLTSRDGVKHEECGWTNEINEFQLASSLFREIETEQEKISLPESDLIHSYCIQKEGYDIHCFCGRIIKGTSRLGGVYKPTLGSVNNVIDYCGSKSYNNKKITLKRYLENGGEYQLSSDATSVDDASSLFIYCKSLHPSSVLREGYDTVKAFLLSSRRKTCPKDEINMVDYVQISLSEYNENKQKELEHDLGWEERMKGWNLDRTARNSRGNIQTRSKRIKIKLSKYDEFAIALGCGIKRKDVDDCVARQLASTIGSGPLTMEQINEVKKDEELMGEVVFAIEEKNRRLAESNEPSEEEQKQAKAQAQEQAQQTEGYYTEQSDGQFVWVDTRSGYQKFTDNFCVGCNSTQVYMINRATKKYYQGAPLSGWDKFVLRGGNARRVIKFYR